MYHDLSRCNRADLLKSRRRAKKRPGKNSIKYGFDIAWGFLRKMNGKKGKVFDEKGRLFGKINVIDLLVIALIIAVAAIAATKLMGRSLGLPGESKISWIEYTVEVPLVQESVYDAVKAEVDGGGDGAQLMADGLMLDGRIIEISSEPYILPVERADGVIVASEQPGYVTVNVTIQAAISNDITQKVGTQEVRIGKNHIVKTKTVELINGIIQTCASIEAPVW